MNTVTVCNPQAEKPFPSFSENTTTYVCLPEMSDYQLFVQAEEPGELTIESDGEELHSCPIDPNARTVPLASVLNPVVRAPQTQSIFSRLASFGTRTRKIREFVVIIKRKAEPSPVVAATFNFVLLHPDQYNQAHSRHLESCEQCQKPVYPQRFIVDWQADNTRHCWNCQEPLAADATECSSCGSEQAEDEPQS